MEKQILYTKGAKAHFTEEQIVSFFQRGAEILKDPEKEKEKGTEFVYREKGELKKVIFPEHAILYQRGQEHILMDSTEDRPCTLCERSFKMRRTRFPFLENPDPSKELEEGEKKVFNIKRTEN